jgi:hypothetical protein
MTTRMAVAITDIPTVGCKKKREAKIFLIQGGPDITCQKNSGSLEGSNKSKKPPFVRSKIMGIN